MHTHAHDHAEVGLGLKRLLASLESAGASRAPRILLPFDGSEAATHAVHYVARNLADAAAHVHLLNVQRPLVDDPGLGDRDRILAAHLEAGERVLRPAAAILEAAGVRHDTGVAFGRAAEAIAQAAGQRKAAIVVMGTRGRNQLLALLAGSVPQAVARIAPVPVLLVQHATKTRLAVPRPLAAPYIAA